MIILGNVSGIQNYLFNVAEAGGGQARALRARSFFLQFIPEVAAVRTLSALDWPTDALRSSAAGKFLLQGRPPPNARQRLVELEKQLNGWLLTELGGALRFSLGWSDEEGSETDQYRQAIGRLQEKRAVSFKSVAVENGHWNPARLVLPPLGTPCSLCRCRPAEQDEWDEETGESRRICRRCADDRTLGRRLPQVTRWVIRNKPADGTTDILGLHVHVTAHDVNYKSNDILAVANLQQPDKRPPDCPPDRFRKRRLMCHVPVDAGGRALWFEHLAKQARGDHLLGILKADADSLGVALNQLLSSHSIQPLLTFGRLLDEFFAGRLKDELESGSNPAWQSIYTVFAGGDDLLMVGPWNVMFDFAGRLHELFLQGFGSYHLTISAGLALAKWKRPVKLAAAETESLLELAKTTSADGMAGPKDQFAAFGQLWKWEHHQQIVTTAKQLADWVDSAEVQRGWLHTLLRLAEDRLGDKAARRTPDPLATARLAHHVARNYRPGTGIRIWADQLIEDFDVQQTVDVRYLPAILRYALTATRTPTGEN